MMEVVILKFKTAKWSNNYKEEILCFVEEVKALKKRYKNLLKLHSSGKMTSFKIIVRHLVL